MAELLELTEKKLSEKLGEHIVAIDMRNVNPYTDYFVIVTARNPRHAESLAYEVQEEASKHGYPVRVQEGGHGSTWILVGLYEVVVHIFTAEAREQYKLEKLWGDQPFVSFEGDSQTETKE